MLYTAPIGVLNTHRKANDGLVRQAGEPIYGGYANRRGEISLFGESIVYRVNFKKNTVQEWPPLNPGAQVRYDATEAGEVFEYGNASFRRLSSAQIVEICSSSAFRIIPKSF